MIDLPPITALPPPSPPPFTGNGAATGVFEQTLGAFLDARDAAATAAAPPALLRQPLADDGNDLPALAAPDAKPDDQDSAIELPWALPPVAVAVPLPVPFAPVADTPAASTDAPRSISLEPALEPATLTTAPGVSAPPAPSATTVAAHAQPIPVPPPATASDLADTTPAVAALPPADPAGPTLSALEAVAQNPAPIATGTVLSRLQVAKALVDVADPAGFALAANPVARAAPPLPPQQPAAPVDPSAVVVPALPGVVTAPRPIGLTRAAIAYVGQTVAGRATAAPPTPASPAGGSDGTPSLAGVPDVSQAAPVSITVAATPTTTREGASAPVIVKAAPDPTAPGVRAPVALPAIQRDTAAPTISVSATPQPAGQVFAAAIAAATTWGNRGGPRDDRDTLDQGAGITLAPTLDGRGAAVVSAAGKADNAPLDLSQDRGLQRVIDHIETLRDTADAHDTRIKLTPDALGSIDIAVRQEGDRVHVRFTTEHEATRALIAEAQPRLTELAAARGVRIGDTSVTADPSGGGNASTRQPPPNPQAAPARPRAPVTTEADIPSDHRLA